MSSKSTRQPIYFGSRYATSDTMYVSQTATYSASTFSLSTTWAAMFMGYAPITFGAAVVKFYCSTVHNWTTAYTGSYMEIGLYSGNFYTGRNAVLTRLYSRNLNTLISATASPAATPGIKRIVMGGTSLVAGEPTSVSAGTPIWIVFGYYSGTGGTGAVTPTLLGAGNRDIGLSSRRANSYTAFSSPTNSLSSDLGGYFTATPIGQTVVSPCLSITYYKDQILELPVGG